MIQLIVVVIFMLTVFATACTIVSALPLIFVKALASVFLFFPLLIGIVTVFEKIGDRDA